MTAGGNRDRVGGSVGLRDRPPEEGIEDLTTCPVCQKSQVDLLFTAHDLLHGLPGEWGIHRCVECKLMLTSPRPDRGAMAQFYPPDYQPFGAPHPTPGRWRRAKFLKDVAAFLLDTKEHVVPRGLAPGRALEVGCGSGRYLAQLSSEGWDVHGLEPSAATVDRLREQTDLPVTVGTIDSTAFEPGSFDLIVAVMVLEHLHSPLEDAGRLHRWLRPGGYISGSVPNCGSWEFSFFKGDWYALQVPTHLSHFTPNSLRHLLEKAGFTEVRIFHQRNVNNLMMHLGRYLENHHLPGARTCLEFPEKGSRGWRLALRPLASVLAWTRQAGRISFTAQKPSSVRRRSSE